MSPVTPPDGRTPVLLSAHAEELVGEDAAAILDYLQRRPELVDVSDVAATLRRTRRVRRHRAVVRAADRTELTDGLRALAEGVEHPLVTLAATSPGSSQPAPRIAFVFPGQGSQWPSMGVEAYSRLPEYRAEVDQCASAFAAAGAPSPLDYLLVDPGAGAQTNDFSQLQIQGAQFVHGVALARVWRSYGVLPDVTVGHSLGEIGAAYVGGAITLREAVAIVIARATVLDGLTGPYRVAVLGITPDQAQAVISETPGWLELSVVNSPSSVAVSGDTEAVAAAVRAVTKRGSFAKEIEMWFPAHTTALDAVRPELDALLPRGEFVDTPVQFIGTTTADVVPAGTDFADYWYTNLRSTVRFDRAVLAAVGHGARIFVELSAHPALLFAMGDVLEDAPELAGGSAAMVGSGRRDEPLTDRLSANLVSVALADPGHRWADASDESRKPLRDFPFAPMRAEHHWARSERLPPIAGLTVAVERWDVVRTMPSPVGPRRAAVIGQDAGGRVVDALRSALDRHHGVAMTQPSDADLLIVVAPELDQPDVVAAADELGRLVDEGLLDYAGAVTARTRDVWLVTAGGERVATDPTPRSVAAGLAAMHRSVGLEHPEQSFRQLDLPTQGMGDATADVAVAVLLGATEDIALRETGTAPTLYRRTSSDQQALEPSWRPESGIFDEVVITGGSGAVGLHYARYLAEHGARRIVLLSRGGVDAAALDELNSARGVDVLAPRCDVTDAAAVAVTAAEFSGSGATLVIHAAGTATMIAARELTSAAIRETCSAKLVGLEHLTTLWPMRADARIMLCSSVSGLWGGQGHAAYSASNRLLDVMAAQQRARGRRCTSVRWGLWQGAGILEQDEVARVERSGLTSMPGEQAVEASLRDYAADPLVFSADAERLRLFLGGADASDADHPSAVVVEPDVDTTELDAATAVRAALGAVLKLADTVGLDLDGSLIDLGVDSLLALDLRKKLKKTTGQNVPLATILGGVTATELIRHLENPENRALSRD
ncbi:MULTISPECIES: mycobactin polyketide synthase MbtD [unclassified Mycobacterium]|uniref:mycobactin polyketide synthase MbtD n=1 Tax=unclassified Mycobacterium TaxID=2642494 RepID=UPI0029C9378A|nr:MULTISPECIES: mycobactin polyketide synthase MbtD [unclassified Mycobacterium]